MLEWIVTSKETGFKLLVFLFKYLNEKYSTRFLKRVIEHNGCQINGRTERFASTVLGQGDHICLYLENADFSPTFMIEASHILFEDEALLIYNKPAGMTSDDKGVLQLWKSTFPSIKLVHRLDRDTTGVLILAKQENVFENLVNQFRQFQVEKSYLAVVDGKIENRTGKIENYLGKKQAYAGQTLWGKVSSKQGLYACTKWERLKSGSEASLVACYPQTGRTHQLRVHLAGMGHPILGDFQYSQFFQCEYRPARILLHAEKIRLHHPLNGQGMEVIAPLPEDFKLAQYKLFKMEIRSCES